MGIGVSSLSVWPPFLAVVFPSSEKQKRPFYGHWRELTRRLAALSVEFDRYPAKELSKIFSVALLPHNIAKAWGSIGLGWFPTQRTLVFFEPVVNSLTGKNMTSQCSIPTPALEWMRLTRFSRDWAKH